MNPIIVPTDFSTTAENALNYALELATNYPLDVFLYHVVSFPIASISQPIELDSSTEILESSKVKMNEKMQSLKEKYPNINFHSKVELGLFYDCLSDYCEELNPIAVVMGISGTGDGVDKIIGSNALNIMTSTKYPLIIVPKNLTYKKIEKICFACDLKNVLESTPIVAIKAFTKLFNATVHILNIDYKNKNYTPDTQNDLQILNGMFDNIKHEFHFIEDENVQHAINEFIIANKVDMLIMLPKKHSWFSSLFHKSHSKEMAYHSHIPLLALHQD